LAGIDGGKERELDRSTELLVEDVRTLVERGTARGILMDFCTESFSVGVSCAFVEQQRK
jgi:hypothetical protein